MPVSPLPIERSATCIKQQCAKVVSIPRTGYVLSFTTNFKTESELPACFLPSDRSATCIKQQCAKVVFIPRAVYVLSFTTKFQSDTDTIELPAAKHEP